MAMALLNEYLMLCMHSWTTALAVWVFRGITQVGLASKHSSKSYLYYALYSWLGPLLLLQCL